MEKHFHFMPSPDGDLVCVADEDNVKICPQDEWWGLASKCPHIDELTEHNQSHYTTPDKVIFGKDET